MVLGLLILVAVNLASTLLDGGPCSTGARVDALPPVVHASLTRGGASGAQLSGQILRKKGASVVLLGNTNSGKTTIFYQVRAPAIAG